MVEHVLITQNKLGFNEPYNLPDVLHVNLWDRDKLALLIGLTVLEGKERLISKHEGLVVEEELEPLRINKNLFGLNVMSLQLRLAHPWLFSSSSSILQSLTASNIL